MFKTFTVKNTNDRQVMTITCFYECGLFFGRFFAIQKCKTTIGLFTQMSVLSSIFVPGSTLNNSGGLNSIEHLSAASSCKY